MDPDSGSDSNIPSTSRVPLQPTTLPLNSPSVFNAPRKRKVAPLTPGAPPRYRPGYEKLWPRLGRKVPLKILEDVTCQIFGYKPYDWQLKLTEKVLEGHDAIGLAGTGSGNF
jgi:hypothetical protein